MNSTTKYTPFTFTTSFDELEKSDLQVADEEKKRAVEEEVERVKREEEEAEAPPPPPSFSEEELMTAKASAFEEGRDAGSNDSLQSIENQTLTALQTITGHIAVLQDRQSLANESQAAALARIAGSLVKKMMPRYTAEHGVDEIKSLVYASLAPLESKGRINISVPPALHSVLEEKLTEVAQEAGFEGRIIYTADDRLGASDIRIDWGRGSAARNIEAALQDMDGIIEQFLSNHLNADIESDEEAALDTIDVADTAVADAAISADENLADVNEPSHSSDNDLDLTPIEEDPKGAEEEIQEDVDVETVTEIAEPSDVIENIIEEETTEKVNLDIENTEQSVAPNPEEQSE